MEKDSDLLNKKKTVQISVTDKDGKDLIFCLAIDKNTQHNYNCSNRCNGVLE